MMRSKRLIILTAVGLVILFAGLSYLLYLSNQVTLRISREYQPAYDDLVSQKDTIGRAFSQAFVLISEDRTTDRADWEETLFQVRVMVSHVKAAPLIDLKVIRKILHSADPEMENGLAAALSDYQEAATSLVAASRNLTGAVIPARRRAEFDSFVETVKSFMESANRYDNALMHAEASFSRVIFRGLGDTVDLLFYLVGGLTATFLLILISHILHGRRIRSSEATLREKEMLLRTIAENYPRSYLSIIEQDLTVGFSAGQEFSRQGLNPEDYRGLSLDQIFGDRAETVREHYLKTFEGRERSFEMVFNNQHQRYRTVPLRSADGSIPRILSVVENITDAVRAQKEREAQLAYMDVLFEASPLAEVLTDNEFMISRINSAFTGLFGYTAGQAEGRDLLDLVVPEELLQETLDRIAGARPDEQIFLEQPGLASEGRRVHTSIIARRVFVEGRQTGYHVLYRDISGRKQAEEADRRKAQILSALNRLFRESMTCRTAAEAARVCLSVAEEVTSSRYGSVAEIKRADRLDTLSLSNPGWEECRMAELDPSSVQDMEIRGIWKAALNSKQGLVINQPAAHPDSAGIPEGHPPLTSFIGVPIRYKDFKGLIGLASKEGGYTGEDLEILAALAPAFGEMIESKRAEEEKERLEAQLGQRHKMEAVGTLAGGIAHDFNNILAAIIGYTDLSLEDVAEDASIRANLDQVRVSALRARDLVRQILDFSRPGEREMKPLRLESVVGEAMKLLRAMVPATVEIVRREDPELEMVEADAGRIQQVIVNLAGNAAEAMKTTGGVLEIVLENVTVDPILSRTHVDLTEGRYVRLQVRDTGPGIDPDIGDRIFEPFFTTREVGSGTGMGLSVVHGIVRSHGGAVMVDSIPDLGAVFSVYLPSLGRRAAPEERTGEEVPVRGEGRVLFVDDEPTLTRFATRMLTRLGYSPVTRNSGQDALEVFTAEPTAFDLVMTDQSMPGMTGLDLAGKILDIRPGIPVILCSGNPDLIDRERAEGLGVFALAAKPLSMAETGRLIRRALKPRTRDRNSQSG